MPQPGFHALLALTTHKAIPRQPWFFLGVLFGSLLPDIDGYLHLFGVLAGMKYGAAAQVFERTITHSLFFAAGLMLLVLVAGRLRRWAEAPLFAAGMGTGMLVFHLLLDVFFWFDSVGLLWPFWTVNLWGSVWLPAQVYSVIEASNYFAFAIYIMALARLTRHNPYGHSFRIALRQFTWLQITLGIFFTLLAVTQRPMEFRIFNDFALLFIAYPVTVWVTWRMRHSLMHLHKSHTRETEKVAAMEWLDVDWG